MLLLMTMPDDKITTAEAREYLRLRRGDELKKLRRKLAEDEDRERLDVARAKPSKVATSATKRRSQVQRFRRSGSRGGVAAALQRVRSKWGGVRYGDGRRFQLRMVTRRGLPPRQLKMMRARAMGLALIEGAWMDVAWAREANGWLQATRVSATHGSRTTPTEKIDGCETNHGPGCGHGHIVFRILLLDSTAEGATSFNRSWLDNDYVEHGQCNVDVGLTLQGQFY